MASSSSSRPNNAGQLMSVIRNIPKGWVVLFAVSVSWGLMALAYLGAHEAWQGLAGFFG